MRRLCTVVLLLALAGACGGPAIPEADLFVGASVGPGPVAPGQGFPVTVTRVWRKDSDPSPWDDAVLQPLHVTPLATRRREDAVRVEEVREFRAYVFGLDDVTVPRIAMAAQPSGGGDLRIAASEPLRIRVRPTLDPRAPGDPELPGPAPEAPAPWWPWALGALVLAAAVLWLRRAAPAPVDEPAGEDPAVRAALQASTLAALDALAARPADVARLLEAAAILRAYCCARFPAVTEAMTSPEIVAALRGAADPSRLLAASDVARFARVAPGRAALDAAVDDALDVVRRGGGAAA